MAGKKFGSATPEANTDAELCTIDEGKTASMTINVANDNTTEVTVRISIGGDVIEPDTTIPAKGVLERTALIAVAGEAVTVRASAAGVTFRAYGIEE